jgi:competence protein ComEC
MLPFALSAFAAGVVLLQFQPTLSSPVPWLVGGAGTLFVALLLRTGIPRRTRGGVPRVCAAAALAGTLALGFGYAAWRAEIRLADALPAEWEGEDITVVGVVDDLPVAGPRGTRFAFAVERVETPGAIVPARIALTWFRQVLRGGPIDDVPEIRAGERWRLVVRLKRPHGNVNPGGFDVEAWLLEQNLRATGYVRTDEANARVDAFAGRMRDHVQRARAAVRARIEAALEGAPYGGVIVALAIGEQRAIPERQWLVFNRTGIGHLISISGLHVTAFAALAGALAFALARRSVRLTSRIPAQRVAALMGALAAAAYVLLAGAQVPAVRTLLMVAVAAVGLWLARPGSASLVWLWALVAVLLWDPWASLGPGFWLSFGAVGLLLYAGAGRLAAAPAASWRERLRGGLGAAGRTQALVTIGLVPLSLALFQQVSLVSPVANAFAIPVVTFVVVPLALAGIVVPLAAPWQAAHAVFAALMVPLEALAALPGAVWQQHAPPAWAVAVAVAGVAWIAAPRGVPGRAAAPLLFLPLFALRPEPPAPGTFDLTVLDVGQGLAAVVRTHRHALVYDAGPRYTDDADAGGRIVAPYLRTVGIRALDTLVVSHLDTDHSGGARTLLQTIPVGDLTTSVAVDAAVLGAGVAAPLEGGGEVEREARTDGVAHRRCERGQRWEWDGVSFEVLHPPASHYRLPRIKTNDLSCVVRVLSGHGRVLLAGDIEARSEVDLVRHDPDALRADVLVVPHHGSITSSTPEFIGAVAPDAAVFTPGYRNRFGHPRPEVVARYEQFGSALHRTDRDGALTFRFAPGAGRAPSAERSARPRYWIEPAVAAPPLD